MRKLVSATILVLALAAGEAPAQENIKIGLIIPLTGNSASAGQQARAAVELGAEIVNGAYPDLVGSPLAGSAGLPNLKHARLQIITANDQGNAAVGEKQATSDNRGPRRRYPRVICLLGHSSGKYGS
jgi:branched-chain amino acid transport system substrate-binding protein